MMKKGTLTACDHDETKVVYPRGLLEGCPLCCEQGLREKKEKTIQSLVEEKYTRYGDGYGFLASDSCGQKVWVNSTSIALEQKDEEIKELQDKLKGKDEALKIAREAMSLASEMHFYEKKGIDKMICEKSEMIEQALKGD